MQQTNATDKEPTDTAHQYRTTLADLATVGLGGDTLPDFVVYCEIADCTQDTLDRLAVERGEGL